VTRQDEPVDGALLGRRLGEARALRERLLLPSQETSAYRLAFAEGDFLPGLTVDVFGEVVAVQFSSAGMKLLEDAVYDALDALLRPAALVEVAAGGVAQLEGFTAPTRLVRGRLQDAEVRRARCLENGLTLEVDPLGGQKTGMFLDQRDNRRRVAQFAKGARVLDVYSYTGGFSLNALRAGAQSALCIDASQKALERAQHHAALNGLEGLTTIETDAFRWLETATPRSFEVVVLDPPKFARARKDLDPALKAYQRLNMLGLTAVAEGGILATASCSGNVDAEAFERMLAGAARDAGRRVQILEASSQGADHPVPPGFAEGRYLKLLLCRVL
jgi:23S rRNA (cytosine1962-C5)-methyltransferase